MATRRFYELDVWQAAHDFVLGVYQITEKFPKEEVFGLTSQFRRAAISIPANIAEGYAKYGSKDKVRFYNIAQGSIEECRYYLILGRDLGYQNDASLYEKLESLSRQLKAYIKGIKSNSGL